MSTRTHADAREDVLARDGVAKRLLNLALDHGPALEKYTAGEVLEWATEHLRTPVAVTLSMQDTVLAELAERHAPGADLIFLDTGYHFDETLDVARRVGERYRNRLLTITPARTRAEQDREEGPDLYKTDPGRCCDLRKVRPLAEMKKPYEGWVTGLKRVDAATRAHTPVRYIADNDLIVHPLTRAGYPSIGCATCTNRVEAGADPRSGRWAGQEKTECGLHL